MRTPNQAPAVVGPRATRRISRRGFVRAAAALASGAIASALTACRTRYIEIPQIVEREVVKVVTQIVRQTVIVPATPEVETPEAVPTPPATPPAPEPPVALTIDGMDHGWNALARRMAPAFQELFPGSLLRWRSVTPWPGYTERIAALAAAGDLADVIEAPLGTPLLLWAEEGILQPLDELVLAEGYDLQGVFPAALNQATHDDQLYGVPLAAHPGACLILANGDLVDTDAVLTKDGTLRLDLSAVRQEGLRGTDHLLLDDVSLPAAFPVMGSFGAQWMNVWGTQPRLHTSASLEALEWAAAIRREGIVPPAWKMTATPESLFASGQAAILRTSFAGLWLLHRLDRLPRHLRVGLLPVGPSPGAIAPVGDMEGVAYGLTHACRNTSLALQWLKYMTTREMGVQMLLGGYGPPGARLAAWRDPRVLDHLPACASLGERSATIDTPPLPWNLATGACFHAWNLRLDGLWDPNMRVREWALGTERAITEILSRGRDEGLEGTIP
jgi:ABC-type glycerol-3-phosphate transport system substrate-binding protein